MSRAKSLAEPRRCYRNEAGLGEYGGFVRAERFCPNYVNQRHPRRLYWERERAEKMCWAYICDWCWEDLPENEEGWPFDDNGRFMQTMECSLP